MYESDRILKTKQMNYMNLNRKETFSYCTKYVILGGLVISLVVKWYYVAHN